MAKPKVLIVTIPDMISPADWSKLEEIAEVTYLERDSITEADLIDELKDYDYLMLNYDVVKELSENFYAEIKARSYPLKAISTDITGMSWAGIRYAEQNGITLMNTSRYSTIAVAEFTLALLLLHVKGLNTLFEDRLAGKPDEAKKNGTLYKKTLGIVGLGNIGSEFAHMAQGLNMNIIAWNKTPKEVPGVENVELDEVFRQSDFISLHIETNDQTIGMINAQYLDQMKEGTIFINEADGKIVHNADLVQAMKSGKVSIYAAASTATKPEEELATRPEYKPVPSQAWFTDHSLNELRKTWVQNVIGAINGKPENVVTKS